MRPRPQMCFVLLSSLLLFSPQQSYAQSTRTPTVTDLFTADEFQHARMVRNLDLAENKNPVHSFGLTFLIGSHQCYSRCYTVKSSTEA
jgi:hypothetical protein